MPNKCCVPGCKSNYHSTGEYVTVFKFPTDSHDSVMRETWKKCIPRKNWTPTKSAVVCRKHFRPCDILILSDTITDDNGVQHERPRKNPVLKANAYPCIFSELSSSLLDLPAAVPQSFIDSKEFATEIVSTVTADIKVEIPSPLEHCQTSLELPDSTSGGELVSTVSGTSDTSQSLAPGQARGLYSHLHCSANLSHRSMLYKHISKSRRSSSSKKNKARAGMRAKYSDQSANKLNMTVNQKIREENLKLAHSCAVKRSYKPVCNAGQLLTHKHKQIIDTSSEISEPTEASRQKLIQENNEMLAGDVLFSESGNSNETLQEKIPANEINSDVCVMNNYYTVKTSKKIYTYIVEKRYKCEFCGARFQASHQLKAHISKHTGVKPFHCDMCGAGFTNKKNIQIHLRRHSGEKPFLCVDCGASFITRRQLQLHITSHTGEKFYKCDVCGSGFNDTTALQAHMVKHTGLKPFHCEVCGAGFGIKSHVRIHMRKHTGEKRYACDDCGARFVNRRQLKVHRISHTGEKPYKCDICGSGYNQAFGLQLHKRKHTGEEPYKCGNRYKPYVCKICGLNFSSNSGLWQHKRKHTGEEPYKCVKIYKQYECKNGYKPYVCEICGLKYSSKYAVQYHKRRHTGEKPHQCDVCGVAFSEKISLINHQRKHTGETPYSCDVCGLRFSVYESLKTHQRNHTGEKPHLCDICGSKFAHSGSLRDHKRLHTGEKPYKCGLCDAVFSNRKKLKRHKKVHAGDKHIC